MVERDGARNLAEPGALRAAARVVAVPEPQRALERLAGEVLGEEAVAGEPDEVAVDVVEVALGRLPRSRSCRSYAAAAASASQRGRPPRAAQPASRAAAAAAAPRRRLRGRAARAASRARSRRARRPRPAPRGRRRATGRPARRGRRRGPRRSRPRGCSRGGRGWSRAAVALSLTCSARSRSSPIVASISATSSRDAPRRR